MKKLIKVTKKHIKDGSVGNELACPVALAVKEQLGEKDVQAGDLGIKVGNNYFKSPRSVKRFVFAFDEGKKVKPFNFILDLDSLGQTMDIFGEITTPERVI